MITQPPLPATAAGLLLAVGSAVAAALIAYRWFGGTARSARLLSSAATGGLVFQVVHVLEHFLQLGFWVVRPEDKPWISAWAKGSADGLAWFCSLLPSADQPSLGVEALHLTGNTIFLGALTSWLFALSQNGKSSPKSLHWAYRVQTFHVVEHVLLVATLLVAGKASGLSTLFGLASGTTLVALRVWFHFVINAIATALALRAAFVGRKYNQHKSDQALTSSPLPATGQSLGLEPG